MKIKLVPLFLALLMCLFAFTGCQSSKLSSYSEDMALEQEQTGDGANASPEVGTSQDGKPKDYTAAYNAYPLDEVMLTVDGVNISWGELFYWYIFDVSNMEMYFGEISDWDAKCSFDDSITNREYVMKNALETIKHYSALERKAADMGVELNEIDTKMLEAAWQQNVVNYGNGDEQAFIDYMATAYLSKEVYDHVNKVSALYQRMLDETFGINGEKLDEKEILDKAEEMGYRRTKHILLSTLDDTKTKLPEDQIAAKKAQADQLYAELSAISDPAALEAKMDELIASVGEDPGAAYYKDGYTFLPGSMAESFDAAAQELDINELSGVVESEFGYHIILRLPLDTKAAVEYNSSDSFTTLGTYVAQELFSAQTQNWANEATVETTEAYDNLDLAKVFGAPAEAADKADKKEKEEK